MPNSHATHLTAEQCRERAKLVRYTANAVRSALLRQDLDHVTILQLIAKRNDASIGLRANAGVSDVAVNRISKVERRCVAGQNDNAAHRSERIDLFRVQVDLESRHELVGVSQIPLPLHQLTKPRDPLIVLLGSVPLAISGALVFSFLDLTTINIY